MAFATTEQVAARMGITFTSAQEDSAEFLLDSATSIVALAVGKDDDWATSLSPVPTVIRAITVEIVRRAMLNPGGLSQQSEQLGSYQRSESLRRDSGDLALTTAERLQLRRAVHGRLSGGGRATTLADHVYYDIDGRLVIDPDADCATPEGS